MLALPPARVWAAESTAYDTDGATAFTFTDSAITAKDSDYTGYDIDGTALTIEAAGTYIVSGSCQSGSITVKKGRHRRHAGAQRPDPHRRRHRRHRLQ